MNTKMGVLFHSSIPEIMEAFMELGPMNATELEEAIGLDNSGLQKILKNLKARGFFSRDKVTKKWSLTYKGKKAAAAIIECKDILEGL